MRQPTLFGDDEDIGPKLPFSVALLALGSLKGLGQKGLQGLVKQFGECVGNVIFQTEAEITNTFKSCGIAGADKFAALITNDQSKIVKEAEEELSLLKARNIHVIPPSRIPERLRTINGDSPKWLFVEGSVAVLDNRPIIAVVGTRKPSEFGIEATRIIAGILAPYPVLVVSGLADGIDGHAHQQTLHHGMKNIAFLGHGINFTFPEGTSDLRRQIVATGGAVVSEYLPSQHYQKRQFVERNRLQAALADIVIPVEAAATSGTAHTINFARRYARPLVGMNWKGANGIVDDLKANNDKLIDIFTTVGRRELDQVIKDILVAKNVDPYPFKNLEKTILKDIGNRTHTPADIQRLIDAINKVANQTNPQESPSDGRT
ncbi:MAG: DNA-processing protein DprA [Gemmataceae bacterium]